MSRIWMSRRLAPLAALAAMLITAAPAAAQTERPSAAEVRERAAAGDADAQWQVGMDHLQGNGTPVDEQEAYRWVVRASEGGSIRGMISRGVMLALGQGVAQDEAAARTWYQRAAETGRPGWAHALRSLGAMLVVGQGGSADPPRGFAYLLVAAASRDQVAAGLLQEWRPQITPEIEREALRIAREWDAERRRQAD